VLAAGALAFAALAAGESVARSGLGREWHGTVTSVDLRTEKHPGVDDVWYVAVDGRAVHVDAALARTLRTGDRLDKDRWERSVAVNGTRRALPLSGEARAMLVVAPLAAAAVAATAFVRR
jgi:hypothetical protein